MIKPPFDTDEVLKTMASECVKQGENLRAGVRELTLKALQTRELSLGQIKQVVGSVTQGVNLGAVGPGINTEKALADALAGMDDALLKAAQASQIALQQLGRAGEDFEHSQMKKALDDLERMEDEFLGTVKQASEGANAQLKGQWAGVLQNMKTGSTETGAQVATMMQQYGEQMQAAMRAQRRVGLKTAHLLGQNFATLASGVLIGLTEALQKKSGPPAGDPDTKG
jgi:hypothetical protein